MAHSPAALVCAVVITTGLADTAAVAASTSSPLLLSQPTTCHPPAEAQPLAVPGATPIQGAMAIQQLLCTSMSSSSKYHGEACGGASTSLLSTSDGARCRSAPLNDASKSFMMMIRGGGASDDSTNSSGVGVGVGPGSSSGSKSIKPGSPAKVAAAKGNAAPNSSAKGAGRGVWGSVARGTAAAWRAVRGGRPQQQANHNSSSNSGATPAVVDARPIGGSRSGSRDEGRGAAATAASPDEAEGKKTDEAPSLMSGSASKTTKSAAKPGRGHRTSGKTSSSTSSSRRNSKGSSGSASVNSRRSFPASAPSSSKFQRARRTSSSRDNVYGAAASAGGTTPPWPQERWQRKPGSLMVSAAERERREHEVRDAIGRAEGELGEEHPRVAMLLFLLSRMVQERGAYDEAEELCTRALNIYETALGPDHPDVGVALNCLAMSWQAQVRCGGDTIGFVDGSF